MILSTLIMWLFPEICLMFLPQTMNRLFKIQGILFPVLSLFRLVQWAKHVYHVMSTFHERLTTISFKVHV